MADASLRRLARLHGIQISYEDHEGRRRPASDEALRGALAALAEAPSTPRETDELIRAEEGARWGRPVEPVLVAWDGRLRSVGVRLTAEEAESGAPVEMALALEDGGTQTWTASLAFAPEVEAVHIEGVRHTRRLVTGSPGALPFGRHRLEVLVAGRAAGAWVIAAPRGAPEASRSWGVFAPIHALRTAGSGGVGDFGDLAELCGWVAERGGEVVATLPPLASAIADPYEPSPYTPVSRLFWNELFVRPEGLRRMPARPGGLVDHDAAMRSRRPALDRAADAVPEEELRAFVARRPDVERYARFRAAAARHGAWPGWPRRLRAGRAEPGDVDPAEVRRGIAIQALADRQLAEAAGRATLLLDLPLGVHPEGYDTWAHRDAFATGVSTGAPPDKLAAAGQDWGFPPLHPRRTREDGHAYLAACVRHLLSRAGALRIDHVMGLHRLYWIPPGLSPTEGVYVRYSRDELYATVLLEAHRAGAALVGEDLGTVPREVRSTMLRRGVLRTYAAQSEVTEEEVRPVPERAQATVNTHDMPPFASFWSGGDIDLRVRLGLAEEPDAEAERKRRGRQREALVRALRDEGWLAAESAEAEEVLRAILRRLAASDARMVVVPLDDLLGETEPLNVPGTTDRYPNWRRALRATLGELAGDRGVAELLREVNEARRGEVRARGPG